MTTPISFELFPPKTDKGMTNLHTNVKRLNERSPEYFSCTYGAGGSTQDRTFETVDWLRSQNIDTAPHLSCIGATAATLSEILNRYQQQNIYRIVALRGDIPSGMRDPGDFRYANELVSFIRQTTGDHFTIEVAAYPEIHPQAKDAQTDFDNFARKVNAGANSAITQYFFNSDAYFSFLDACEKRHIDIPIVPGILPITNYTQLSRFSDACGAEIPRWIRKRLEGYGDDIESIQAFGEEVVTQLCEKLITNQVPSLHFYTMNQSQATLSICDNLSL